MVKRVQLHKKKEGIDIILKFDEWNWNLSKAML